MRKVYLFVIILAFSIATAMGQQAKYVFYFIGDGMGLNQVNGTESYLAELQGRIGIEPLTFPSFPYTTYATSFSASNGITDSAAGGTALATGVKTFNGALGVNPDTVSVNSIAVWAKNSGKRVGVCTTVSIDHATPAAFYAHVPNRNMYNAIGHDLAASGFDFFGGSDFLQPVNKKDPQDKELHQLCEEAGYTWAYGYNEAQEKMGQAQKLILTQTREAAKTNTHSLPYAIDRKEGDLTLAQIVETGIEFLSRNNKKGFFFMVEGGKIDHACHANDAGTTIQEVIDFDLAIQEAMKFYKKHPKETLIVVTADHETGGLGLGNGKYAQNLKVLQYQTVSTSYCTEALSQLRQEKKGQISWEDAKAVLAQCYGLFDKIEVNWRDEAELRKIFEDSFSKGGSKEKTLYQEDEKLAAAGRDLMSKIAMVAWGSYSHSNAYVPVYAIGAGAEQFHGRMNNIDIPVTMAKIAGYTKNYFR